jgi:hypothetical protein
MSKPRRRRAATAATAATPNEAPQDEAKTTPGREASPSVAIRSVGRPPERHADRVVAEMMRQLARDHSRLWDTIAEVAADSSDGSPRAQRKMQERIKRAGPLTTELWPGKRGRYTLLIYDLTGYDQRRDAAIQLGDPVPERPWISCNLTVLTSEGRGRNRVELRSRPMLFVTHHAVSRAAQCLGVRTTDHLIVATKAIWNGAVELMKEKETVEAWLDAPPQGGAHRLS